MDTYNVTIENLEETAPHVGALLRKDSFPVAITGAGISVASGLPLIGDTVLGIDLKEFFRPDLFRRDPDKYYDVYREALISWRHAVPNTAHRVLAEFGAWIITQNIDGLHWDAGSRHVIELHGNFRELLCEHCREKYHSALCWQASVPRCPRCDEVLTPAIVLEGQEVRHFSRAVDWVGRANSILIVGTGLEMEPVGRLPKIAELNGAAVIWVNSDAERVLPRILAPYHDVPLK